MTGYWNKYWIDILHNQMVLWREEQIKIKLQKRQEKLKSKLLPPKKRYHSEETKRRISEALKGRKRKCHSEETKKKISEAHKGKNHSDESKRKMSESHRGSKHSLETKNKIANSHIGKHHTEETKAKMRESRLNLEDFIASKGGLLHRQHVKSTADQWKYGTNKVETEKLIHLPNNQWRIIDVLVNDKICIEVGFCKPNKIEELKNYGFEVIHLPYSDLEELIIK